MGIRCYSSVRRLPINLLKFISVLLITNVLLTGITLLPAVDGCNFFDTNIKGSPEDCSRRLDKQGDGFLNLPIIQSIYCFNNGSGICKGLSGKFEFYFDSFNDKVLGPAPENRNRFFEVNKYGLHKRKPVAYDIRGNVVYADQSINWARGFRKFTKNVKLSILSVNSIDWCRFVRAGNWPYRASMLDYKSSGRYEIYFFNRQTCIYDKKLDVMQNFNTRFLGNSTLRIDLDANPLMFAMEDPLSGDVRVVKNKRQHWYESPYEVMEVQNKNFKYFIKFGPERGPSRINSTSGCLFGPGAYRKFTNVCVTNYLCRRNGVNNGLLKPYCGPDETELADFPLPTYHFKSTKIPLEASLHNLPRYPEEAEKFFGINIGNDADWEEFAHDGFTFTASTTIPLNPSSLEEMSKFGQNSVLTVRAITLFADYKAGGKINDPYDENYPQPFLADYEARYSPSNGAAKKWDISARNSKKKPISNLNYIDDLAYLHKCKTILIIYGPLYTEIPADKFSFETTSQIESIYDLGLWELANALFAEPGTDNLWVYHRTNFIVQIKYTCSSSPTTLVRGKRVGDYHIRYGPSSVKSISEYGEAVMDYSEESFWSLLGIYKGSLNIKELAAPDPDLYSDFVPPAEPGSDGATPLLVYIIVGIGILIILAMCIACLITMRRRRKHAHPRRTQRSSMAHGSSIPASARSSMSNLASSGTGSAATRRSSMHGKSGTGRSHTGTMRSGVSSRPSSSSSRASARSKLGGSGSSRKSHTGPRKSSLSRNSTGRSSIGSNKSRK